MTPYHSDDAMTEQDVVEVVEAVLRRYHSEYVDVLEAAHIARTSHEDDE